MANGNRSSALLDGSEASASTKD